MVDFGFQPDLSVKLFQKLFDNGQSNAGALKFFSFVQPLEQVENPIKIFLFNTYPIVFYGEDVLILFLMVADMDFRLCIRFSIFQGIVDKVGENL